MKEKTFVYTASIDDNNVYQSIETIAVKMVEDQEQMIAQTLASEIDKTYNGNFREITIDRKKLGRALNNAMPQSPSSRYGTSEKVCGSCFATINESYNYCPICGRKIKWN